jgi:small ligand-binding sensory domain FIST
VILSLGGRPALAALREAVEELHEADGGLLQKGLFVGRVVNEYKDRFGRDDYLIRAVSRVDEKTGAIAVTDFIRVGQTVRFHLRDARTAHEDLAMLLDAQQLHDRPAGGLLISCNGRGTRLFDQPNHDAAAVVRAFQPNVGGEAAAKIGQVIAGGEPPLPLAGFFAAGEIGPVGHSSYVHGHTACLAVFRAERAASEKPGNLPDQ